MTVPVSDKAPCRKVPGSLMFLASATRPDLSFPVLLPGVWRHQLMLISRKLRKSFVTYEELLNTSYCIEQTASKESLKFTATQILPMIYIDSQHQVLFASMRKLCYYLEKQKANK